MKLNPEHYFRAALERVEQSRRLYYDGASYALAMYVSGVAVECLLRAFKLKRDPTFDERHDLQLLFKASGMLEVDTAALGRKGFSEDEIDGYQRELQIAVNEICILWANDYRYVSENRLRSHLKGKVDLRKGVKGDVLKANALRLMRAAQRFIDRGVLLWSEK
jgi:hypothetical protein